MLLAIEQNSASSVVMSILKDFSSMPLVATQLSKGIRTPSQVFVLCCSLVESAVGINNLASQEIPSSELKAAVSKLLIPIIVEWLHGEDIEARDFTVKSVGKIMPDSVYSVTKSMIDSPVILDSAISILISGSKNASILQTSMRVMAEITEVVTKTGCFGLCSSKTVVKREPIPVTLEDILEAVNRM